MSLIHATSVKPKIFPIQGAGDPAEINRAQSIDPSASLEREAVDELGRKGAVGYISRSPDTSYSLTQYEYGNIEFWRKITNKESGDITLDDFKTSYSDIAAYLTDDDDNFKGTLLYPELAVESFSLAISEPQAIIERTFDFTGEKAKILQGGNANYVYKEHIAGSGADNEITLDPLPVKNPDEPEGDNSDYFIRIVRVRGGVTKILEVTTDYNYDEAGTLTIISIESDDVIKVYYTATAAPEDEDFTLNNTDKPALIGDCVDIFFYVPESGKPSNEDKIYRLQDVTIDVSFDREDYREIGNKDIIARAITDETVSVSLGRILDDATVEEVLRGVESDYGIIDIEKFTDRATLIVKIYDDNTKSNFKYGFKAEGLSPTDIGGGVDINAYMGREITVEGKDLTITDNADNLPI